MISSFSQVKFKGKMGDPVGHRLYQEVDVRPLEKWKTSLSSPIRKAWCRKYLKWMGSERLSLMGYDKDRLIEELNAIPPWRSVMLKDMFRMVRDVFVSLIEPAILKDKLRSPRDWRRVWNHF